MKKILFSAVALLCMGVAANAQTKSEMYVGGSICGSMDNSFSGTSTSTSLSGSLNGSFGYFFTDNLRAEMSLGFSGYNTISNDEMLSSSHPGSSFNVRPSAAYYMKIADNIFYTPEIGTSLQFGQNKSISTMNGVKSPEFVSSVFNWFVYAYFAQFEYRLNAKFAVSFSLGSLSFGGNSNKQKGSSMEPYTSSSFGLNLNSGSISVKYYL